MSHSFHIYVTGTGTGYIENVSSPRPISKNVGVHRCHYAPFSLSSSFTTKLIDLIKKFQDKVDPRHDLGLAEQALMVEDNGIMGIITFDNSIEELLQEQFYDEMNSRTLCNCSLVRMSKVDIVCEEREDQRRSGQNRADRNHPLLLNNCLSCASHEYDACELTPLVDINLKLTRLFDFFFLDISCGNVKFKKFGVHNC